MLLKRKIDCLQKNGFTLVELLISLAISLIIITTVLAMYSNTLRSSYKVLDDIQLSEELTALINIISNDVRKSGYWSDINKNYREIPFSSLHIEQINNEKNYYLPYSININEQGNCISFGYDNTANGSSIESDDLKAYRLKNQQIYVLQNADITEFSKDPCDTKAGRWMSLTDNRFIKIDTLNFSLENSQCINLLTLQRNTAAAKAKQSSCFTIIEESVDQEQRLIEFRQLGIQIKASLKHSKDTARAVESVVTIPNHQLVLVP